MIYQNDDYYIRPLEVEDVDDHYVDWLNDPKTNRYTSRGKWPMYSRMAVEILKTLEGHGRAIVWAIFTANGKHIGNIGLHDIDMINRSVEIAWLIGDQDYWGKGVATLVGKWVLTHAFNILNLHRVWCGCSSDNHGMIRVTEKLKMELIGASREGLFIEGQWRNILHFSLLRRNHD